MYRFGLQNVSHSKFIPNITQPSSETQNSLRNSIQRENFLYKTVHGNCSFFCSCFFVTEARGEIQNFVHNFLENPTQEGTGHQSEEEPEELNVVEVVKDDQIVVTT